ncbi:ABC1 family-domain-containing protein [Chytriomyces sp. MP71]|nr:ABC1 family-domain-containing protein [Chytriomyces sp. MP71]
MIADHGSIFARAHFALSLATRILALAFVFLPVLTALPLFVYLNSTLHTRMRRYLLPHSKELKDSSVPGKINALWFITLLSWSLQAAGPAFIKLAQYASSREDLFSYEVCKILSKLQDQGRPHSMFWTRRAFKKEHVEVVLSRSENISGIDSQEVNAATKSFEDVFEEFDETPVGVGAIAQVYKGRLKSNHKQVAIKVLHPYVVSLIQTDLIVLNLGAQALTAMFPKTLKWLSLPDEVAVFSTMMRAQTDLRTEASNLVQFSRNFEGWTVSSGGFGLVGFGKDAESVGDGKVLFPTPVLCSPSILVEEYIDAVPVSRFLTVRHHQELTSPRGSVAPSEGSDELVVVPLTEASRLLSAETGGSVFDVQVAKIGMQSFVKMLLVDNFCHADLHPGNILVSFLRTKGGSENSSDSNEAVDDEVARCLPYGVNRLSDLSKVDDDAFLETMATLKKEGFVPAIVYLDAGLVSTLSPQNLVNLNDLLVKIVQFDGPGVARLLVERQRLRDDGGVIDFEGFSGKMAVLLNRIRDSSLKLSTVSFSWILRQVFGMVRSHHVRLEGDFANVGVAVMLVEGVGRRLDPGVDLLEEVRNIVANEWALAVGDVWLIRGVLEIYATAKRIGQELVNGQWLST